MITTNTGAKKLESSDNWREIFPNPGTSAAGAHNASVDAHDRIQAEVAPIINGKRCSLGAASGDYVLLRNSTISGKTDGAYQAAKAIPANTDLDSTYLGNAITGGISNALNSNITQLKTTPEWLMDKLDASGNTYAIASGKKISDYRFIYFYTSVSGQIYESAIIPTSLFTTACPNGFYLWHAEPNYTAYNYITYIDDTHIYFKQDNSYYRSNVYGIW